MLDRLAEFFFFFLLFLKNAFASRFQPFPTEVSFRITIGRVILFAEMFSSQMETPNALCLIIYLELQAREVGC